METFEKDYAQLIVAILHTNKRRATRNGETIALFGLNLHVDVGNTFPILQGRKMYPNGVFGELAAMLRCPKHIDDFTKWGCNYWAKWAKPDGSINVDYGNAWFADNQMARLFDNLANNPTDRRMIINGWRPDRLDELDLPCCHYSYQFYVEEGKLHMLWNQRSVDMMIGLPSDIVFAAMWLIILAKQFNYKPGFIQMSLGDCHVYAEHEDAAKEYTRRVFECTSQASVQYTHGVRPGTSSLEFDPIDMTLKNYYPQDPIKLELKA
jgi:thymidylate synthase